MVYRVKHSSLVGKFVSEGGENVIKPLFLQMPLKKVTTMWRKMTPGACTIKPFTAVIYGFS
jgi:hypothetical protein